MEETAWGRVGVPGLLHPFIGLFEIACVLYSLNMIYKYSRRRPSPITGKIFLFFLYGIICMIVIGGTSNLLLPHLMGTKEVFPLASSSLVILSFFIYLAVKKYNLLTIDAAQIERVSRALFNQMNEAVIILDSDFIVVQANPRSLEILGTKWEDLKLKSIQSVLPSIKLKQEMQDIEINYKDGNKIHTWSITIKALGNHDQKLGYILILRDLTVRKKVEKELQKIEKLESIGILAGGIAHDFRNLLISISGYSNLLKDRLKNDATLFKWVKRIKDAAEQAEKLSSRLLVFSKGGKPIKRSIDLVKTVKESMNLALSGSNIMISYYIADEIPHIQADSGQLSQVFNNLALNAAQAMPSGGQINVVVDYNPEKFNSDKKYNDFIRIRVVDQGCGIPPDNLQKVFDPFFTTKTTGSGLGLTTCFTIINDHGGRISIDSQENNGTVVTLEVPAIDGEAPFTIVKSSTLGEIKARVLVMDDIGFIRDLLQEFLKKIGSECVTVSNSQELTQVYQAGIRDGTPFDIVILDATIKGGYGGVDAMRQLLELDPQTKGIIMSGYSDNSVISRFKDYGFQGSLVKPFTIEQLQKTISDILQ
jgi:PAS domain S-box-containing protein